MEPLNELNITPEILRLIADLDEFKGRWQASGGLAVERLSRLRRVATIESVGSSTRIEGVRLSDQEVEALLSRIEMDSFRSRDEQEVAGYAAVMEMVFESWSEISLTQNHLRQLHRELLKHSQRDEWHRGSYKTMPNHLEAFDAEGKSLGVVFETTSAFETPRRMELLVHWTKSALDSEETHPLLASAVFVVRFLAIHPFQDGNGRLSRVVTMLLLLRAGYTYVPYSSLERIVEENKDHYYRALRRSQATLDRGEDNLGEWVVFFLRCLARQKNVLVSKLEMERRMAPASPLGEALVDTAHRHGRLTVAGAVAATGANRNTIKSQLRKLVEARRLTLRGRGRGTWYEVASADRG